MCVCVCAPSVRVVLQLRSEREKWIGIVFVFNGIVLLLALAHCWLLAVVVGGGDAHFYNNAGLR